MMLAAVLPLVLAAPPQPLLLTGGTVYAVPGQPPRREALLIADGRVAALGQEADLRKLSPHAQKIDLLGATLYPGWHDAHGHLLGLGQERESLDLRGRPKAAILDLVRQRASRVEPGTWIRGRGWDQNLWPGGAFPTAAELSAAAPRHPVVLSRVDGHALWVNELALEKAGVPPYRQAPADPPGGRIVRTADGRPSGIFVDAAEGLISKAIPAPSAADLRRAFEAAFASCVRVGLTGVGDASGYGTDEIAVLRALAREGKMPLRVYATVGSERKELGDFLGKPPIEEGRLTVRAVKVYADGALGSRGAALKAPYADDAGNTGLVITPGAKMEELAERSFRAGFQVWIHAIGDRGNELALTALAQALAKVKPRDPRPRIEHAQVLALEDIPRFAKLGVIASIQPTHATSDMPWAEARLGPVRIQGAYAWRKLVASGARLAGGSDFPVESEDPRLGFYAAVTRQDTSGRPPGGWRAEECLKRSEALRLFTTDVAYAELAEAHRGTLEVGRDADITVLDRDVASPELPAAEILRARVLMTVVGGEIVHRAGP